MIVCSHSHLSNSILNAVRRGIANSRLLRRLSVKYLKPSRFVFQDDGKKHMPRLVVIALLVSAIVAGNVCAQNECTAEINGALRGGPGNIQDHMFHSIAIDPTNGNIVYAGTETSGIFKTIDGGITWTRLRLGFKCTPQKTGYSQIFDIAIDPTNSNTLYAAAVNGPGPADNPLYPSASGGGYASAVTLINLENSAATGRVFQVE